MCAPYDGFENDIAASNRRFMEAFAARDAAGIAALYPGDGQLLPPNSDVVVGRDAIGAFWQQVLDMGIASATLETDELEGFESTAIEVGRYTLGGDEGQILDQGKFIVIWKYDGSTWKLHRDIWNTNLRAT